MRGWKSSEEEDTYTSVCVRAREGVLHAHSMPPSVLAFRSACLQTVLMSCVIVTSCYVASGTNSWSADNTTQGVICATQLYRK